MATAAKPRSCRIATIPTNLNFVMEPPLEKRAPKRSWFERKTRIRTGNIVSRPVRRRPVWA